MRHFSQIKNGNNWSKNEIIKLYKNYKILIFDKGVFKFASNSLSVQQTKVGDGINEFTLQGVEKNHYISLCKKLLSINGEGRRGF